MKIVRANPSHIPEISRLFDLYRQFYGCEPDLDQATRFITDRMTNHESVIFVAETGGDLAGFVQLYPSFCSVEAIRIYILYDLYVDAGARRAGVGEMLMKQATEYSRSEGASRIDLLTAKDNKRAQRLYQKLGYEKTLEGVLRLFTGAVDSPRTYLFTTRCCVFGQGAPWPGDRRYLHGRMPGVHGLTDAMPSSRARSSPRDCSSRTVRFADSPLRSTGWFSPG